MSGIKPLKRYEKYYQTTVEPHKKTPEMNLNQRLYDIRCLQALRYARHYLEVEFDGDMNSLQRLYEWVTAGPVSLPLRGENFCNDIYLRQYLLNYFVKRDDVGQIIARAQDLYDIVMLNKPRTWRICSLFGADRLLRVGCLGNCSDTTDDRMERLAKFYRWLYSGAHRNSQSALTSMDCSRSDSMPTDNGLG